MTSKKSAGFDTPAKDLQDAMDDLQRQLSAKKADWKLQQSAWQEMHTAFGKAATTGANTTNAVIAVIMCMSATQNCRLAIELTETHERLAAVEKAIRELKLRT